MFHDVPVVALSPARDTTLCAKSTQRKVLFTETFLTYFHSRSNAAVFDGHIFSFGLDARRDEARAAYNR